VVGGECFSQGLPSHTLLSMLAAPRDDTTTTPKHPPPREASCLSPQYHSSGARGKEMVAATYPLQLLKLLLIKRSRNSFVTLTRPCRNEAEINFGQKHRQDKATSLHPTSVDLAAPNQDQSICPTPAYRGHQAQYINVGLRSPPLTEQTALAQVSVSVRSYT